MNLGAIAKYLNERRIGRIGETLFVTEMPAECKEGVLLMHGPYGTPIDHELPGWRDTGFRVVVRSVDYLSGEKLMVRACAALQTQTDVNFYGEMLMKRCLPFTEPRPYRRSQGGYWEFEVEMDCTYIKL